MKEVYLIYPAVIDIDYYTYSKPEYNFVKKPPLGLQYLASSLLHYGINPKIFDQSVERFSFKEISDKIIKEKPLFVGIYSDSNLKPRVLSLIKTIKSADPTIKIVVGGPACVEYEDFHKNNADIVCHGEGDVTIREITDYFLEKKRIGEVKGISFLKDGKIYKNKERELIKNLDTLPFPTRDKIRLDQYYDYHIFGMKQPYASIIASRGCPFRCTFCASNNFWKNKQRYRSVENVIDEIDLLVNKYHVKYLGFKDDSFGLDINWIEEFVEKMKERNLNVSFSCMPHPFSFKGNRRKMLSLLKEVGLDIIIPGLQSVDKNVLKNINRDSKEPEYLEELILEAKKLSITTVIEFIFGLPGDNEEIFKKNLAFALKVKPHYALFYNLTKLPGSDIAKRFNGKNVSCLDKNDIKEYVKKTQKAYFTNPGIIIQDFRHVLSKNPKWFLKAGKNVHYLIKATGF